MTPTPGPWMLHTDGLSVFGAGPNRQQVADLGVCSPNIRKREQFANAHLIAAAPELVGCCRELLAVIDRHLDPESLAAVVARMRDVVAKADGLDQDAPSTTVIYPAAIKFYLPDVEQRQRVLLIAAQLHLRVIHRPHTVAFDVIVPSFDVAVCFGMACGWAPAVTP